MDTLLSRRRFEFGSWSSFALLAMTMLPASASTIVINEIDADTPGADSMEFVELFDGGTGSTSLSGLTLVFFNGSSDTSYRAIDLAGFMTDADGYFVLGNAAVTPDILFPNNSFQNGADAVALYQGSASDFPNGTLATTTNLQDAIGYGTGDADDAVLLLALGLTVQYDESGLGDKDTDSIGRRPDGSGNFVTLDTPTPGTANQVLPPGSVPVPAAIWLFITAIIGVLGISKQKLTIIKRDRLKVSQLTRPINSVAI